MRILGALISSGGSSRPAANAGVGGKDTSVARRTEQKRRCDPWQASFQSVPAEYQAHERLPAAAHSANTCTQVRSSQRTGDVVVDGLLHRLALLQGLDLQRHSAGASTVGAARVAGPVWPGTQRPAWAANPASTATAATNAPAWLAGWLARRLRLLPTAASAACAVAPEPAAS